MPSYDIINWHRGPGDRVEFVKVGQFDSVDGSQSTFEFDVKKVFWGGSQEEVSDLLCPASPELSFGSSQWAAFSSHTTNL